MPLLATLKSETATQHTSLENSLDLFERAATPEGYRRLLAQFYGLYRPMEEDLAQALAWEAHHWDFGGRRKTPWLETDLSALGLDAAAIARLPVCDVLPPLAGPGAVIGCLYVLEGSTLGGQFISRQLRQALGIDPESGGRCGV